MLKRILRIKISTHIDKTFYPKGYQLVPSNVKNFKRKYLNKEVY